MIVQYGFSVTTGRGILYNREFLSPSVKTKSPTNRVYSIFSPTTRACLFHCLLNLISV